MENKLLAVIVQDRVAYNNIRDTLEAQDLSDMGQLILSEIFDYYSNDPEAESIDSDILLSRLGRKYPEQLDLFTIIMEELKQPVSTPNVLTEYVEVRLHAMGRRLATMFSGNVVGDELQELMTEYNFLYEKREEALAGEHDDNIYIGIDDRFFEDIDEGNLIQLAPSSLNARLDGGVPRGSHIVVYARPEAGKSAFILNLAADIAQQGLKVALFGNEDPVATVRTRALSNMTGRTRTQIRANRDQVTADAIAAGFENMIFVDLAPGSVSDVRRLVHRFQPDVFIVDQIRNLYSTRNLTKVEALEFIAQSMRNLAKESNTVGISVTQAGDSAEGKLVLDLSDVDFSKTGIPSTADLMIGLGTNHEYEQTRRRVISLPKNKISGNHESFPVEIDPQLSRIIDI